jgi:hypothetical protein
MSAVATWTAGTTTGATMATEFNKVAKSLNTTLGLSRTTVQALTTTATAIGFDTQDKAAPTGSLISHSTSTNNTRITASEACTLILNIQPQVTHLTTGTGDCTFWVRKNGTTPIGNSAAKFRENGALGTAVQLIIAYVDVAAGDYIEVMGIASANSEYELTASSASGSGATMVPITPSIILTVDCKPL